MPPFCIACNRHHDRHERCFRPVTVPVPEGMTYADAEAALADAGVWVEVSSIADVPKGARTRSEWRRFADYRGARFYIHRDDLPPADPDAELVEKMAQAAHDQPEPVLSWGERDDKVREMYRAEARAALAALREHEASR